MTSKRIKRDILKEFGNIPIPFKSSYTHYHIKKVTDNYVLLEDKCPKKEEFGYGNLFKFMIDIEDEDDIKFRENCKKVITWARKNKRCPELGIHFEVNCYLEQLIEGQYGNV